MPLADIQTIVIVMLENRSFDHLMGYLSLADAGSVLPVEGLKDDPAWQAAQQNAAEGKTYGLRPLTSSVQTIADPPHDHASIGVQINTPAAGGMRGFVQSYVQFSSPQPPDPGLVMGYYDQSAVPIFDFFARNFTICDHWFAALPLGTQANRLMAMSGASSIVDNASTFLPEQDLVYDWLTTHNVDWCAYQSGDFFPFFSLMPKWLPEITTSLTGSALGIRGRFRRYSEFAGHWQDNASRLPRVIFIEPEYTDGPHADPNDDHPPTGQAKGQAFVADIYNTMISNPARWQNSMMIVTYDEHGGFFDHVPPLPIPATAGGVSFTTTGVRVPAFIVSPHVQPGVPFTGNLDHTSLLQLLADKFNAGQTYSAAVGARQPLLAKLSSVLAAAPAAAAAAPKIQTIPAAAVAAIKTASAKAPAPPAAPITTQSPPNAQALHNVAMKVAKDHPDLLTHDAWKSLRAYVNAKNQGR